MVETLRYVALGDSYTIGTSVAEAERWPNQLVDRLRHDDGRRLRLAANLAVNGFTSGDVLRHQLPQLARLQPEFVTLLVGVNDVVQGVQPDVYEGNVAAILHAIVGRLAASRVMAVSTPDYTVTPRGAAFGDPVGQRAGIVRNNTILRAAAELRGVAFVDIFDVSVTAALDRSLVAADGLHPSGSQYTRWIERIEPVVRRLLA